MTTIHIKCDHCGNRIEDLHAFHAGFSNRGFLYCDRFAEILEFDAFDPHFIAIVGDKHPWSLTPVEQSLVEEALEPSPRGGRFRFAASPRCPACNAPIEGLLIDRFHFIEIGDVIDADSARVWRSSVPRGSR
ncbi:MAG: hypothetical protein NTU45_04565 [Planctomycetota bacterium]|jgi:hypothetical protein|nr:hypothetical protein [Planctomycetota bacterium]